MACVQEHVYQLTAMRDSLHGIIVSTTGLIQAYLTTLYSTKRGPVKLGSLDSVDAISRNQGQRLLSPVKPSLAYDNYRILSPRQYASSLRNPADLGLCVSTFIFDQCVSSP